MKELIIGGIDLETTGLDAEKGHRITEVGLMVCRYRPDDGSFTPVARVSKLINPKRDIPTEIQQLTGITPSMVKDAPVWEDVAPKIAKILNACHVFVAHNAEFDATFLTHELDRVGLKLNPKMRVFCTMQEGRFATPLGKVPNLGELAWSLDVPYNADDAHRAIYDVDVMMAALDVGLKRGYFDFKDVLAHCRLIA